MSEKNPMDKAFAALLNDDDAKALEALAMIQQRGDASSIIPLLRALASTDNHTRQRRIKALLFDVKVKGAAAELGRALDMPDLRAVRETVIAAFWNSELDALPYMDRLVQIAVEGTTQETIEVLTLIENQHTIPESVVRKSLAVLANASTRDPYGQALLDDVIGHLRERLEGMG